MYPSIKKILLFFIVIVNVLNSKAAVDTIFISSNSMHKEIKTIVITPASYKKKSNTYPVVYLLHGAMGNSTNWITKVPELQSIADEENLLIVCPDGSVNSWYFDSPVDSTYKYETHVSTEVPEYIDSHYRTIKDRKARAITGLSMGGHGAMFIAFRHSQNFGACGSMSGALNVSLITRGYDINKRLGDTILNKKYYTDWSVLNVIEKQPSDSLAIIMDCGLQDFIYGMTKATHEKLISLKIPHDYIERPGKHDWKYWANAVRYQLIFFNEYFKKQLQQL
jgi:S-formylglutathione hydrolase FrmB